MHRFRRIAISFLVLAAVAAATALAQRADVPLTNWTVPAYHRSTGPSGGLSTMADLTPGVAFVGMVPCRVVDTRPSQGFGGAYGPPIMAANAIRTFDIDSGPCTGIPAGVDAYSLNFAVTETAGAPGDIRAFPTGSGVSVTSVLNWNFVGNGAIANAIIIPAGTDGAIDVQVAGFNTHLVIDINGYFTDTYNTGVPFRATGNTGGGMISGTNASNADGAAGVKGMQGPAVPGATSVGTAGVIGTSALFNGVLGITQAGAGAAVRGVRLGVTPETSGELGAPNLGGLFHNDVEIVDGDLRVTQVDLTSRGDIEADGNVTIAGNLQVGGGTKNFVEPHPTDPSKLVQYVSLEGPESGTYFRGRGRFQNGLATIRPPEDFRIVTDAEGLSVQITPIGEMATYAVVRIGIDEIVLKASRNVEFFYTVNGVRRAHKGFQPIADSNGFFVRRGERSRIPANFPDELRRRLIANGTYREDGTVNMDTARRLGWDRVWAAREREDTPSPVSVP
jgi:hypothetical protein